MSSFLRALLLLALVVATAPVSGVTLHPDMRNQLDASAFEYWIADKPLSRDEILAHGDALPWQPVGRKTINFKLQENPVWVRFPLRNGQSESAQWLLLVPWIMLAHVDMHVLNSDGTWREPLHAGYRVERENLPVNFRMPVFPLQLAPGEEATVYLRAYSKAVLFIPLLMKTPQQFRTYENTTNIAYGMGFGVLLAMMLYNLSLFIFVRDRTYLVYSLYVLTIIFYMLAVTGFGSRYAWSDWAWLRANAYSLSAEISFLVAVLFGRLFLRLHRYGGWFLRLNTFMLVYWALAILCNLAGWIVFLTYTANLMALLTCVIGLVTAIILMRRGDRSARYFTIAWSFIILGTFFAILMTYGAVPFNALTENVQMTGFVLELLLLSLALADRINRTREQRVQAQQQALAAMQALSDERSEKLAVQAQAMAMQQRHTEELELRVLDRTAELERAMKNLELANKELAKLSVTDPLTKLHNRRYFDETLQAELSRAVRTSQSLALILVDIDHFKSINDTYGHLVGDECLKLVASTIRQVVTRSTDLVARYGGEEFAVVLPATPEKDALEVANRIRVAIEKVNFIHAGKRVLLSASLGVAARNPTSFDTPNRFITAADEALYRAKESGRNRVIVAEQANTG